MAKMVGIDEAYQDLANAIIEKAASDYRIALASKDQGKIKHLESFFRSTWYHILTAVDGDYIMNKIKEEMGIR